MHRLAGSARYGIERKANDGVRETLAHDRTCEEGEQFERRVHSEDLPEADDTGIHQICRHCLNKRLGGGSRQGLEQGLDSVIAKVFGSLLEQLGKIIRGGRARKDVGNDLADMHRVLYLPLDERAGMQGLCERAGDERTKHPEQQKDQH